MSKLYGRLKADMSRSEATKRGSKWISAQVETWVKKITVTIQESSQKGKFAYFIEIADKNGNNSEQIKTGMVE